MFFGVAYHAQLDPDDFPMDAAVAATINSRSIVGRTAGDHRQNNEGLTY
jgi:hypothetical protein